MIKFLTIFKAQGNLFERSKFFLSSTVRKRQEKSHGRDSVRHSGS